MKKIVIIGGGSGTSTILSGLKKLPFDISAIISSADDGGSSGRLRKEFKVMPPGDLRQCLIALSETTDEIKNIFDYRFTEGELKGHCLGNIIIATLEKTTGNHNKAILELSKILNVKGKIMFSSCNATTLSALYKDGTRKDSEHEIDEPKNHKSGRIINLSLNESVANKNAIKSIKKADAIIIGPGDLYTSLLPNILVKGISNALAKSKAKKILITNIMTKYGQTDDFKASDFLIETNKYLAIENPKSKIDIVFVNTKKPRYEVLNLYKKEHSKFIEADIQAIESTGTKIFATKFFSEKIFKKKKGDNLKRSILRHDSKKISDIILKILKNN